MIIREGKVDFIIPITKRWPISCLLLFLLSCQIPKKESISYHEYTPKEIAVHYNQVQAVVHLFKTGDLIFRNGNDEISATARSMNRIDTSFSHCGIILKENDSLFVYHILGGPYNPTAQLLRDPIDSFLMPIETNRFATYRYQLSDKQINSLETIVKKHHRNKIEFDVMFNLNTDDKMYCSEFVYKSMNEALTDSLSMIITPRPWPLGITPDDLFLNSRSRLIKRIDFSAHY